MSTSDMPQQVLRFEGTFDYYGLLDMIYNWFRQRDWKVEESKAVMSGGGDREIKWKAAIKESDYVKFEMGIVMVCSEFRPVDSVVVNGEQKQLFHGRFSIELDATMITDWQKQFHGSKFKEKLGKWYESFVYAEELGGIWEDKLQGTIINLYDEIKRYLNMESRLD